MACSCDSCSSPRIVKTRTALFWRWLAQDRGETADRVIPAPARVVTEGRLVPRNESTLARRAIDHAGSPLSPAVAPA